MFDGSTTKLSLVSGASQARDATPSIRRNNPKKNDRSTRLLFDLKKNKMNPYTLSLKKEMIEYFTDMESKHSSQNCIFTALRVHTTDFAYPLKKTKLKRKKVSCRCPS